jgi:FkbM family methyltransferase
MKDMLFAQLKSKFEKLKSIKKANFVEKIRLNGKTVGLFKTEMGKYYLPLDANNDIIANTIIRGKIYDESIVNCAKQFIKPNTAVLDVGANFGQMTVLFSKMLNGTGKVYAFEAGEFVFSILEKNVELNNCKNVKAIFGAVADKDDEIHFYPEIDFKRFQTYGSYRLSPNDSSGHPVKSLKIDSLNIPEKISFMKIDIQGYDLLAMKGAVETIKRNKMPIVFEFEYLFQDELNISFQEYVDFVLSIGYRFERVIDGQNYLILPKKS